MTRRVSFHTLGCKLNFSETSTIARQFEQGGFVRAERGRNADVCVINTCAVTEHAEKKCRYAIRRIIRENPDAIIAVTGCYAQLQPEKLSSIEGVDLVIGNSGKGELYARVAELAKKENAAIHGCSAAELHTFFSAFSSSDRTRAFLKVQDGCSYRCSYCTIPMARGESRSPSVEEVIKQACGIAARGIKEVVLTGINTGDFGRSTGETFVELLRRLSKVKRIERYRISSIEPNLLTDEVIETTARCGKFQPHFHIPLQSGCDRILALMRRRYNTEAFAERIAAVRARMDDPFIGIDVITGFPGESGDDFFRTVEFIETIRPAFLHVFPYSVRPGTPAGEMEGKVPPSVIAERTRILTRLSGLMHQEYLSRHIGKIMPVLFESTERGGCMSGYTPNYICVTAPYDKDVINTIREVRLAELGKDGKVIAALTGKE